MVQELEFEVLDRDRVVCKVFKKATGERTIEYTSVDKLDELFCPYGDMSDACIEDYYRERIFPETRVDKKRVLKELNVPFYDPELVCRRTKGMLVQDTYWVRFPEDKDMGYEEAKRLVYGR